MNFVDGVLTFNLFKKYYRANDCYCLCEKDDILCLSEFTNIKSKNERSRKSIRRIC